MKDYQASVEKLRTDAAEAARVRDLATDPNKRDIFDRLHQHLNRLADEVERAMNRRDTMQGVTDRGEAEAEQALDWQSNERGIAAVSPHGEEARQRRLEP